MLRRGQDPDVAEVADAFAGAAEDLIGRGEIRFDREFLAARIGGRRLLVTGAGGSVGTRLAAFLASLEPSGLVLVESHEPSLFHLRARMLARYPDVSYCWTLADVRDERKLAAVFAEVRPELVFHLAAYKHVPLAEENVDQAIAVNVVGAECIARVARGVGATVVYTSTDKAVRPPSIYGATKRLVELYLLGEAAGPAGLSARIVRLVNVVGSQGSVIETFARQIRGGLPVTVTDSRMTRYWMTVDETCGILAWAAVGAESTGPYVLNAGEPVSIEETARRLHRSLGTAEPLEIRHVGIRPGERLYEELAYDYESLVATHHPGVRRVRDDRPEGGRDPGYPARLEELVGGLYSLGRSELRRRLFELAT